MEPLWVYAMLCNSNFGKKTVMYIIIIILSVLILENFDLGILCDPVWGFSMGMLQSGDFQRIINTIYE